MRWFSLPPVFHPHSQFVKMWMKVFMVCSLLAFFIDPLFFFAISISQSAICFYTKWNYVYSLVAIRSFIDTVTLLNILLQMRLAFNATHHHLRKGLKNAVGLVKLGELVFDPSAIFWNYFQGFLLLDVFSMLPLPQIIFLVLLPRIGNGQMYKLWEIFLRLLILLQDLPRARRLSIQFSTNGGYGHILKTAWASFVLSLFTFFMASHVIGSLWYLQTLQRVSWCLHNVCLAESSLKCALSFLDCPNGISFRKGPDVLQRLQQRQTWAEQSNASAVCFVDKDSSFPYGIFRTGIPLALKREWFDQWLFSLMWGFQQISTLAGDLQPSSLVGEVLFMLLMIILGLFLFAFLIGNMNKFLQSLSPRYCDFTTWR